MQIDPLEAIIKWLTNSLTVVGGRVAGKHRYEDGWTEAQNGLSVHWDGGPVDLYATVATPRIELRIYAAEQPDVVDVYRNLTQLSRENERFAVETSKGNALVHYFQPQTSLSILYDDVLKKEMGMVFFEAMVSEIAVT